jgi:hypothetical protein
MSARTEGLAKTLEQGAHALATFADGLSDAEWQTRLPNDGRTIGVVLDRVAPNSLYGGAPLTCQFMLEDHAVRHSFHHLARIRAALSASAARA